MRHKQVWIDAILGTGLKSDVRDYFREIIEFINSQGRPVFAVDIPSGLNSDTGKPCGCCIEAQATATFAFAKTGHILYPGAQYTGSLTVIDIGIPHPIAEKVGPLTRLITQERVRSSFKERRPEAHKGDTGHILIVAGSPGKTGAAAMAAMSAMRSGAGLVTLAAAKSLNPVLEPQITEAMTCPLPETIDGILDETAFDMIMSLLTGKRCMAIGPGVGTAPETKALMQRIVQDSPVPLVIDADGINCIADNTNVLKKAEAPIILTPHPGEMARLIGKSAGEVQEDRIGCARDFAVEYNCHLVLKGARTVIAHPDEQVFINPTGNPGMASGGMGDVLTGIIAGFISQGMPVESAAQTGVYLHGFAADGLAEEIGSVWYLATDIMDTLPEWIAQITEFEETTAPLIGELLF
jgi:NAD(P)H-hydrate epimerase